MQMLTSIVKRLVNNKKQSIYSIIIVALAIIVPVLTVSVAFSFAGNSYVELVNISFFMNYYVSNPKNSINQMCMALNVLLLIVGSLIIIAYFINKIFANKNVYKSYLLMGATYGQVAFIVWLENSILLLAGIIVGAIMAWLMGLLIGAIWSIKIIFNFDILLISALIYWAVVSIISLIRPLWVTTSVR